MLPHQDGSSRTLSWFVQNLSTDEPNCGGKASPRLTIRARVFDSKSAHTYAHYTCVGPVAQRNIGVQRHPKQYLCILLVPGTKGALDQRAHNSARGASKKVHRVLAHKPLVLDSSQGREGASKYWHINPLYSIRYKDEKVHRSIGT
jgi:hypothetical protein